MPVLRKAATRSVRSRVFDSARWDNYQPRDDDIIIGTYSKCGTTWMQRIVSMLVFRSAEPQSLWEVSPWPDMRLLGPVEPVFARAEAQTHRRFLKTHLPLDAVPQYEGARFIHVARDGRDAAMSLHNHLYNFNADTIQRLSELSRNDPKFADDYPPVPESAAGFFSQWLEDGGAQGDEGASFFHVENAYWAERANSNLLLVHYNDLKADLGGEMRRVARFLEIDIPSALWPDLVAAAGFDAMKANGDVLIGMAQRLWAEGSSRFLHKGSNGRWQNVVSKTDLDRYDALIQEHFSPELARWIENGRLACPERLPVQVHQPQ